MGKPTGDISARIYGLMLYVYPAEFRQEFGAQMRQVFRDCERVASSSGSLGHFWFRVMSDLIRSSVQEHYDSGKEHSFMNTLRRDLTAWLGCVIIIALAFLLLSYGRANQVSSILVFGRALDAIVTAGVVGNLIIFLVVKFSKLNPLRVALWTFLIVDAVPALLLAIIGSRIDPDFRVVATVVAYVVSFWFWFGLHWAWWSSTPRAVSES
jgi:hypothetical protein